MKKAYVILVKRLTVTGIGEFEDCDVSQDGYSNIEDAQKFIQTRSDVGEKLSEHLWELKDEFSSGCYRIYEIDIE